VRHGEHAAAGLGRQVTQGGLDPGGDRVERLAPRRGEGGVRLGVGQRGRQDGRPQLRPAASRGVVEMRAPS
jgi:hypothetical protein